MVRHGNTVRETRRTAGILQIANFVSLRGRQIGLQRDTIIEFRPINPFDIAALGCFASHFGQFGREKEDRRIAAFQLHHDLVDIAFLAAKTGWQRQRHRPGPSIDATEEKCGKFRPGFGNHRDPVFLFNTMADQPVSCIKRIRAHLAERIGTRKLTAHVMKVQASLALRCIIQRISQCLKV